MAVELHLDKMTTSEKLEAMEAIWADLSRSPSEIVSPQWHADLLQDRKARVAGSPDACTDWTKAKRDIREQAE